LKKLSFFICHFSFENFVLLPTLKFINNIMAEVIRMPLLSDTMKEGKIAAWLKNVGDVVKGDDILAEVETDKATMEVMGYADGTLLYIGTPAGSAAKIDEIIAIVGKPGEDISAYINEVSKTSATAEPTTASDIAVESASATVSLPKELTVVTMPLLSDTMKEGKIASWIKNIGDTIKNDDIIAEVETDKATMEVMAYAEGTLLYKGAEAGSAVLVNGVMAIVGPKDFDLAPYMATIKSMGNGSNAQAAPAPIAAPVAATTQPETGIVTSNSGARIFASPLAKKVAADKGINLSTIKGSGDGGRIVLKDLSNVSASAPANTGSAPMASVPAFTAGVEGFTEIPVTQMRGIIAKKLSDSMFTAPHFYLKISVALDNLLAIRTQVNNAQPVKVSINDMLIKACALSLRQHPAINSSWLGDKIRTYQHIHIGSAIALPDGLIVPVIKFADQKTLPQIAEDANGLYDKAKNKKIQPVDFTGNTFTISNLGMMDIEEFTAIINPPDACILAVGKGTPTPVVDEKGNVVVKTIMKLTLSCDHRVVDGSVGALFLKTLKNYIENPIGMFL
jgi:pyruvate dehydrogenase E2 component (dihydrolipoamide acetyltransferase)